MDTKKEIERNVKRALEKNKLDKYNIDDLDSIMKTVATDVSAKTYTVEEGGKEKAGMVEIYMVISYLASFMIYIFIFMFGSMVMRGVIEEKTNRVVEVIVSSVKPFELMLGKILGVGAVAVVQFLIWVFLTMGITIGVQALMGGNISPADLSTGMQNGMPAADLGKAPLNDILAALAGVDFLSVGVAFFAFFILGYLLYASMFSAVGSAVDNETDTQQLVLPVTLPLIIGLLIMVNTFQYPDSNLSFWGSMIPFTSPMVMMARVPFGVPAWEMILSILILFATFLGMTYISAKIYRIGILSYGKKASWKDLWKWIKY
jgi:ABC-2 type transport system permease protein